MILLFLLICFRNIWLNCSCGCFVFHWKSTCGYKPHRQDWSVEFHDTALAGTMCVVWQLVIISWRAPENCPTLRPQKNNCPCLSQHRKYWYLASLNSAIWLSLANHVWMKVFRIMRPLGGILQCSKSTELGKTIVKLTLSWYQPGPQGWKAGPYSCIAIFQGVHYNCRLFVYFLCSDPGCNADLQLWHRWFFSSSRMYKWFYLLHWYVYKINTAGHF